MSAHEYSSNASSEGLAFTTATASSGALSDVKASIEVTNEAATATTQLADDIVEASPSLDEPEPLEPASATVDLLQAGVIAGVSPAMTVDTAAEITMDEVADIGAAPMDTDIGRVDVLAAGANTVVPQVVTTDISAVETVAAAVPDVGVAAPVADVDAVAPAAGDKAPACPTIPGTATENATAATTQLVVMESGSDHTESSTALEVVGLVTEADAIEADRWKGDRIALELRPANNHPLGDFEQQSDANLSGSRRSVVLSGALLAKAVYATNLGDECGYCVLTDGKTARVAAVAEGKVRMTDIGADTPHGETAIPFGFEVTHRVLSVLGGDSIRFELDIKSSTITILSGATRLVMDTAPPREAAFSLQDQIGEAIQVDGRELAAGLDWVATNSFKLDNDHPAIIRITENQLQGTSPNSVANFGAEHLVGLNVCLSKGHASLVTSTLRFMAGLVTVKHNTREIEFSSLDVKVRVDKSLEERGLLKFVTKAISRSVIVNKNGFFELVRIAGIGLVSRGDDTMTVELEANSGQVRVSASQDLVMPRYFSDVQSPEFLFEEPGDWLAVSLSQKRLLATLQACSGPEVELELAEVVTSRVLVLKDNPGVDNKTAVFQNIGGDMESDLPKSRRMKSID